MLNFRITISTRTTTRALHHLHTSFILLLDRRRIQPPNFHPLPSPPFSSSTHPPFHPAPFTSSPLHQDSDFESDSDDPTTSQPNHPELPHLLHLLSDARSRSSSQDEALLFLRSSPAIKPSSGLVYRALWELRWDWESALLAFRWARESVLDCPRAWHLMIWALGKQGRFDLAWCVLRRMHRKSVLTRRAMIVMIQRYAAANEVNKAIQTFHAMEKFKINADTKAFYALLHTLCKNKNVEEAEELLLNNRKFFPLETEGFNIVLHGWCNIIVDVVEAKRVWREMSNYCIMPDGSSYAHMIYCFSRVGNLFDSLRLYDQMKKRGWVPNLMIYNSLVYVLTRENCLEDASNIFNKCIEAGLEPNVETYNSMIYPLCEAHKLEEARKIMDGMIEKGISPTIETYHAFTRAEDTEGTLKLLKRMRDSGSGPSRETFILIFDKFFGSNMCESALRIWSEMRRYDVAPDSSHYIILVQGLARQGWMPKALEIYNKMKSEGYSADPKLEKLFKAFLFKTKNHWRSVGNFIARRKHNTMKGVKVYRAAKFKD